MRFWLLHAVGSIHAYLSGQVLLSLGTVLDKALPLANDLEAIITGKKKSRYTVKVNFSLSFVFLIYSSQ